MTCLKSSYFPLPLYNINDWINQLISDHRVDFQSPPRRCGSTMQTCSTTVLFLDRRHGTLPLPLRLRSEQGSLLRRNWSQRGDHAHGPGQVIFRFNPKIIDIDLVQGFLSFYLWDHTVHRDLDRYLVPFPLILYCIWTWAGEPPLLASTWKWKVELSLRTYDHICEPRRIFLSIKRDSLMRHLGFFFSKVQ